MPPTLFERTVAQIRNPVLLLGRLLLGYIFLESGFRKLFNMEGFVIGLTARGVPWASFLAWVGTLFEFLGGIALVIGFQVRLGALVLVIFTIAATWIAHRYWQYGEAEYRGQRGQFFKNLAIIGGLLALFISGGGRFGLDRWLRWPGRTQA
jgi:putative oxidoreductase